jgi:hypothetical protein
MKKTATLALLLTTAVGAWAQTNPSHDAINLEEVVVRSTMPKTHIKGDAQITRIAGSILEKAGSSIDVLKRLPMVEAKDEAISVMGRGNATIYINGREIKDLKELSQLQSDRIARVEVVQNPGARYSASTKAVVRIYLKKEQGEGFSLDNETRYGYIYDHTVWENLALNFRKDGFDIGLKLWGERQIYGHDNIVNQNTYLDEKWTQAAFSHIRNKSWHWAPTLTLNWQLSEDKSFGMRYSYYRLPKQMPHGSFIDTDVRRNDVSMERSMALITSKYSTWNHATNLILQRKNFRLADRRKR